MLKRRDLLIGAAGTPPLLLALAAGVGAVNEHPAAAPTPPKPASPPYQVVPGINPELKAHGAIFERKIHQVGNNVYAAVGWSGCNSIMVVGNDGVVIVDCGSDLESAREVADEFRKITDKPVRAVIYTCFHLDHISGVRAFASAEDVAAGRVELFAHETLLDHVIRQGRILGPILGLRTAYNFGLILEGADIDGMNNGTGPILRPKPTGSFIAPTRTFATTLDVTICGLPMTLMHAPSEAADEIVVFLPESQVLLCSEVIPAQHFPALHTLRGEAFRDPVAWYESIDRLRRFKATAMVPAHGLPVVGPQDVEEILCNYRDAIQFVHDQTIRLMNRGLTPDEMVDAIHLPPHLANFKPWMQEFFGSVSQAIRGLYQGYLGWFEGDPLALDPVAKAESARREVALMGGREKVLAAARKAFEDGDPQWAAELATRLVRVDREDMTARQLKGAAFRKLGYAAINAVWRNWYLSAARELDGFDLNAFGLANVAGFVSPDLVKALPAKNFVRTLSTRLKAEETLDLTLTVGFQFPDVAESCGLSLRRGVGQFDEQFPEKPDLVLTFDKAVLDRLLLRQLSLLGAVLGGEIQVSQGSYLEVARFFGYFELPLSTPVRLALR